MKEMPKTPELEKIKKVREVSQKIGEFLDWLGEQEYFICEVGELDRFYPINTNNDRLLEIFFEIDGAKAEEERRLLINYVREQNEESNRS